MVKQGRGGRTRISLGAAVRESWCQRAAASKGGTLSATYSWAVEPRNMASRSMRSAAGCGVRDRRYLDAMGHLDGVSGADDDVMRELGFYSPEEAAPLATWLSSEEVDNITGFHMGIDGPRILVYDRVRVLLKMNQDGGWTEEMLEQRLRPAILQAAATTEAVSQRRPPDGQLVAFDDRV